MNFVGNFNPSPKDLSHAQSIFITFNRFLMNSRLLALQSAMMALIILNELGPEYNAFVVAATTTSRHDPHFFSDLHSHEALLASQSSPFSQFSFCLLQPNSQELTQDLITIKTKIKNLTLNSILGLPINLRNKNSKNLFPLPILPIQPCAQTNTKTPLFSAKFI
jgi:hypothetical protein